MLRIKYELYLSLHVGDRNPRIVKKTELFNTQSEFDAYIDSYREKFVTCGCEIISLETF